MRSREDFLYRSVSESAKELRGYFVQERRALKRARRPAKDLDDRHHVYSRVPAAVVTRTCGV